MAGGLTFSAAKESLRTVVDNGVDVTDDRVMRRTNEATQEILGSVLPVNGMMIADIAVTNGNLMLPAEMESATHVEIITDAAVNNQTDVRQGWYDIVSNFTYVDPMAAHDNPLIDNFEVPDPIDPTILRRSYTYPGFDAGTVRVTGPKSYQPVTTDDDYLIVQNVPALKLMIQAIERRENLDIEGSKLYKAECIQMLTDEVKGHQMDPRRAMKRKGDYEADLRTYAQSSMGWMRARLALEVPGAMSMGKEEITRLMERAEMLALEMGTWKGTLEEFDATIYGGVVYLPARVESMLKISLCGEPIPIRSFFFNYLDNGPGNWDNTCGGYVRDLGEEMLGGTYRRKFGIAGDCATNSPGQVMRCVCKLRWVAKQPSDQMTIRNLEAMRLLCDSILLQQQEKWDVAKAAKEEAKQVLDDELKEYLKGVEHTLPFVSGQTGFGYSGEDCL